MRGNNYCLAYHFIKYVLKAENLFKNPPKQSSHMNYRTTGKPALVQATLTSSLMAIL